MAATAEASIASLRGGGQPLPTSVRAFFEPVFQRDFSRVRIHTGREASEAAQAVQARAFTAGRDIVFGAGEYVPESREGQRLLAHELTHVLQQDADNASRGISDDTVGRNSHVGWDQAHAHGQAPVTSASSPPGSIQRQPEKLEDVCKLHQPLAGFEHIRSIPRSRLAAAGFTFCGPSDLMPTDPLGNYWERWVHPTQGVLHFQVHWEVEPAPEQKPGEAPEPDVPAESGATEATYQAEFLTAYEVQLEKELAKLWEMDRNKDPQLKARLIEFWKQESDLDDKLDEAIGRFSQWDENTKPDELEALDAEELRIMQLRDRFQRLMVTPSGGL